MATTRANFSPNFIEKLRLRYELVLAKTEQDEIKYKIRAIKRRLKQLR